MIVVLTCYSFSHAVVSFGFSFSNLMELISRLKLVPAKGGMSELAKHIYINRLHTILDSDCSES